MPLSHLRSISIMAMGPVVLPTAPLLTHESPIACRWKARVVEGGEFSSAQAAVSGIAGGTPAPHCTSQTTLALPGQLISRAPVIFQGGRAGTNVSSYSENSQGRSFSQTFLRTQRTSFADYM